METPSPYQGKEVAPVLPASRHTILRSYPSQPELQLAQQQMARGWAHLRPFSVLVAAMGNHWKGASWNKVVDMIEFTQSKGVYCALSEVQDRCFDPYDALGTMRNEAIMTAKVEGFDYILYLDNDVQPEPDMLMKLLAWEMPIVAPFVAEPGTGKGLHGPELQVNTGLQRAKWSVLSALLFKTTIFNNPNLVEFWRDAIGADEGYHFMKLYEYGHYLFVDTNTQLIVGGRPLYPLALNRLSSGSMQDVDVAAKTFAAHILAVMQRRGMPMLDADHTEIATAAVEFARASKGERDIMLQTKIARFVENPDRRAIDPNSPYIKDGEYAPFVVKAELAQKAAVQATLNQQNPSGTATSVITMTANTEGVAKALAFSGVGNG